MRLALLTKRYLAIPASSAPSERTFSHLNIVVSKRSSRMLPDHADVTIMRYNQTFCVHMQYKRFRK